MRKGYLNCKHLINAKIPGVGREVGRGSEGHLPSTTNSDSFLLFFCVREFPRGSFLSWPCRVFTLFCFSDNSLSPRKPLWRPQSDPCLPCREIQPLLISPSTAASWRDLGRSCQTPSEESPPSRWKLSPGGWKKEAGLGRESLGQQSQHGPRTLSSDPSLLQCKRVTGV